MCLNYFISNAQPIPSWKITQIESALRNKDSVIIINFWATFCIPCIEEMPELMKVAKQYENQKVKLYFVSLDFKENYPGKLKSFVAKRKWKSNFIWLNETNADYFCPFIDSSWTGSLPATIVYNYSTGFKHFWEQKITASQLEAVLEKAVTKKN